MKSLINNALFKENLKRFWAIGALSMLSYILFVIMPLWSQLSNKSIADTMYGADSLIRIITMRNPLVLMTFLIGPFASVLTVFSYLFQAKSTTTMHAYPFSKKQLFCTNIAAGLVLIIVPLLLMCLLLLKPVVWNLPELRTDPSGAAFFVSFVPRLPAEIFPNGLADGAVINTLPVVGGFFLRALLANLFYYSVFLLGAAIAGNAIICLLLCGALPLIPTALTALGYLAGNFYFFGFSSYRLGDTITRVFTFTNPIMLGSSYTFYAPQNQGSVTAASLLSYHAVYAVIALALFTLSYWCFLIRRQERAGDSIVFTPIRNLLIFLLSILGMIFIGAVFLSAFKSVKAMYLGFVIGFIITYFIAWMIAEKTFNVLYKAWEIIKYSAAALGLFAVVIIIARFDLFGYQTYSPKDDEVYGVYLHSPYQLSHSYNGEAPGEEHKRSFFVRDERIVFAALAAHKQIINDRHSLRNAFLTSLTGNMRESGLSEQNFTFLLKSGEYVERRYTLPKSYMQDLGLFDILSEEAIILSQYYTFRDPENISAVVFEYNYYTDTSRYKIEAERRADISPIYIREPNEVISVMEEVKKDLVNTERERILIGDDYNTAPTDSVSAYAEYAMRNNYGTREHFGLQRHENVDKWLSDRGLK